MARDSETLEQVIGETQSLDPNCAICGAVLPRNVQVRMVGSSLRECRACGGWTYLPRHGHAKQLSIHDSADYFDHPYFACRRAVTSAVDRRCRWTFARLTHGMDPSTLRNQRLLDIGCDTGDFLLSAARQFGIAPVGIDVSGRAVSGAVRSGIEAYHCDIEHAPAHLCGFSFITAIDLIEHVIDPGRFLFEVSRRLRPDGLVYLETPNIRSVVYRLGRIVGLLTGAKPSAIFERLFPPQHAQYFTVKSLRTLAEATGLQIVQIGTRVLPSTDIGTSVLVRAAMATVQLVDRYTGDCILIWAVLRRRVSSG